MLKCLYTTLDSGACMQSRGCQFSFFVYSSRNVPDARANSYILLHPARSTWLALNETSFKITQCLNRGFTIKDISDHLATRYATSREVIEADVRHVSRFLSEHRFLDPEAASSRRIPVLDMLLVRLTDRCNMTCAHCCASYPGDQELSYPNVLQIIDELYEMGGQTLVFGGGEPLLHPRIRSILEYATKRIQVRLVTNGSLIDGAMASFLSRLGNLVIQISIEGATRAVNDVIRQEGSLDKVLKAVEYFRDTGVSVELATTVMKQNLNHLVEIVTLADQVGVQKVHFLRVHRTGRAARMWDSVGGYSAQEYLQAMDELFELQKAGLSSVEIGCGLNDFKPPIAKDGASDEIWCPIGKRLTITSNGDAFPCPYMVCEKYKLGNVFLDSLGEIMRSEPMKHLCDALVERRTRIERCSACCWRNLCQAGCMARALEERGTIWDVDRFCEHRDRYCREAFEAILADFCSTDSG